VVAGVSAFGDRTDDESRSVMSPRQPPTRHDRQDSDVGSFIVTAASTSDAEASMTTTSPDHHVPDVIAAAGPPSTRASPERDGTGGDDTDCEPEPGCFHGPPSCFKRRGNAATAMPIESLFDTHLVDA